MTASVAVRLTGVTGLLDTDWLDLTSGLAILTGRNNVGKSRLLLQIHQLAGLPANSPTGTRPFVRAEEDDTVVIAGFAPDGGIDTLTVEDHGQPFPVDFSGYASQHAITYRGAPLGIPARGPAIGPYIAQLMPRVSELQLVAASLQRLVYLPPHRVVPQDAQTTPALIPDPAGTNLAQVLYTHSNRHTAPWTQFEQAMSRVFPEIARVYVDPIGSSQIRITFRDRFSAADVPLSGTGTGVEQILFFVAMVLFSPADRIFLVDEPHVFLHPGAERELVAFLREHSEHSYVCATHSPVFIAAASPDATWLVTRDEHGSRVASVFAYTISRATIFRELGISAGEVALAERILFVEGPSDNDIYPILLSRIGYSLVHHHTSIIRLYGADTARPLKGAIDELERILRIDFQVCLDGDKEASFTPSPRVRFLSVPEIESLFLLDPVGVHTVFSAIANEANAEGAAPSVPRMTVEQVAERVRTAPPQAKAAHVLRGIARKMGIKYNKAVHGVKLAEAISETALAPFRQTFNDWLQ